MGATKQTADADHAEFIAGLVSMVESMIPDGQPTARDFDAATWVARWLGTPQPALGGRQPRDYLDTAEGRGIVRRLLAKVESGAYQ